MKKSILSLTAVVAISGAFTIPVQAEEVTVKNGDTLWGLSQSHKVSVEDIKSWNQLTSDYIYVGDSLHISQEEQYTVKAGDTLSKIANKYHVSIKDLKSWNNLNTDTIHPKQALVIKPAANKVEAASTGPDNKAEQAAPAQETAPVQKTAPTQPEKTEKEKNVSQNESNQDNVAKEMTVRATAYTADCQGCSGVTATGVDLKANPNQKVISVDPSVIPLGTKVYVEGYGYATAADTGSAIKGNKVDIFIPNKEDALNWGVKNVNLKILN
ncbi:LysM peptidoglycan-binding domain-containing protein [Peribacillus sp. NPDC097264]|uniref:3D domain-containing protein n=1 Tax=Peribacillus sp. NPDC097264 TaxID=3390616 RepID=UPI003D049F3F